jgi:hypothetical protein
MTCPCCQCPECRASRASDPIEAKAIELRAACAAAGIAVTPDGFVSGNGAAQLLGLAPKTIMNWRYEEIPTGARKVAGRVWYPLAWVASRMIPDRAA